MRPGLTSSLVTPAVNATPRLAIGSVRVSGIDDKAAGRLGAAIERALAGAARSGALVPQDGRDLHLVLPHGANERDIAAALLRALGRR